MEIETISIAAGGHTTRLMDAGEGPSIVVLHGWGGRIESMAPVIDCLRSFRRVLAFDLPGFGESAVPRGAWATRDYATFIRDCLAEVGIPNAAFVGHSFGAKISLYLAATQQDLVDKVVAMGSSGLRSAPSVRVRAKRVVSKGARIAGRFGPPGRALRAAAYKRVASTDYQDAGPLRPTLVKVVNEDIGPLLARISAPTLLVWGTEDDAVPVAHARSMERLIPDAGLVLLEGAGHFAYLDEPGRCCTIMKSFFGAPGG